MADPKAVVDDPGGGQQDQHTENLPDESSGLREGNAEKTFHLRAEISSRMSRRAKGRVIPVASRLFKEILKQPDTYILSVKGKQSKFLSSDQDIIESEAELSTVFVDAEKIEKPPGPPKMVLHFKVATKLDMYSLRKGMNDYLRRTRIRLYEDHCGKGKISTAGFYLYIHPEAVQLDKLRESICDIALRGTTNKIEVRVASHGVRAAQGPAKYITTKAVTVFCKTEKIRETQGLLMKDPALPDHQYGYFVPYGKIVDDRQLENYIRQQNGFLHGVKVKRITRPEGESGKYDDLMDELFYGDDDEDETPCMSVYTSSANKMTMVYKIGNEKRVDDIIGKYIPQHRNVQQPLWAAIPDASSIIIPSLFPNSMETAASPAVNKRRPASSWSLDTSSKAFPSLEHKKVATKAPKTKSRRSYADVASTPTTRSPINERASSPTLSSLTLTPKTRGSRPSSNNNTNTVTTSSKIDEIERRLASTEAKLAEVVAQLTSLLTAITPIIADQVKDRAEIPTTTTTNIEGPTEPPPSTNTTNGVPSGSANIEIPELGEGDSTTDSISKRQVRSPGPETPSAYGPAPKQRRRDEPQPKGATLIGLFDAADGIPDTDIIDDEDGDNKERKDRDTALGHPTK